PPLFPYTALFRSEVLDDHGHVVRVLALRAHGAAGRVEHAHGERRGAASAVGHTELHPSAALDGRAGRKRTRVQEDVLSIVGRDEAEALLVVVEPDLAGGHRDLAELP